MPISDLSDDRGWFDSHCHLNDVSDPETAWKQAESSGIDSCLIPGTHPQQWPELDAFRSSRIHIANGTHPWFVLDPEAEVTELEQRLQAHSVDVIGEIGLDFFQGKKPRPERRTQLDSFSAQLNLAEQFEKPVIIHAVKAHQDIVAQLKKTPAVRGVIHAFVGSPELARQYLDAGFCLGIGPQLLKSEKLQRAVAYAPLDRLLLETDAPYMALERDAENPLLDLLVVARRLSELKDCPMPRLQQQTLETGRALFRF